MPRVKFDICGWLLFGRIFALVDMGLVFRERTFVDVMVMGKGLNTFAIKDHLSIGKKSLNLRATVAPTF